MFILEYIIWKWQLRLRVGTYYLMIFEPRFPLSFIFIYLFIQLTSNLALSMDHIFFKVLVKQW